MVEVYFPKGSGAGGGKDARLLALGLRGGDDSEDLPENVSLLKDVEKELQNAIKHLERSNQELRDEDPTDEVYIQAIEENEVALLRKHRRLSRVQAKIQSLLGGGAGDPLCACATANPSSGNAATDADSSASSATSCCRSTNLIPQHEDAVAAAAAATGDATIITATKMPSAAPEGQVAAPASAEQRRLSALRIEETGSEPEARSVRNQHSNETLLPTSATAGPADTTGAPTERAPLSTGVNGEHQQQESQQQGRSQQHAEEETTLSEEERERRLLQEGLFL